MPSKPDVAVAARGLDEAVDQLLDLGLGHGVAAPAIVEGGHARGRPVGLAGIVLIAMLADVVELMHHHRAMRMAGVGDLAEMRDDRVALMPENCRGSAPPVRWTGTGSTTIIAAPPRARSSVVAEMALAGQALLTHVGGVGAEDDAVASASCGAAAAAGRALESGSDMSGLSRWEIRLPPCASRRRLRGLHGLPGPWPAPGRSAALPARHPWRAPQPSFRRPRATRHGSASTRSWGGRRRSRRSRWCARFRRNARRARPRRSRRAPGCPWLSTTGSMSCVMVWTISQSSTNFS